MLIILQWKDGHLSKEKHNTIYGEILFHKKKYNSIDSWLMTKKNFKDKKVYSKRDI